MSKTETNYLILWGVDNDGLPYIDSSLWGEEEIKARGENLMLRLRYNTPRLKHAMFRLDKVTREDVDAYIENYGRDPAFSKQVIAKLQSAGMTSIPIPKPADKPETFITNLKDL